MYEVFILGISSVVITNMTVNPKILMVQSSSMHPFSNLLQLQQQKQSLEAFLTIANLSKNSDCHLMKWDGCKKPQILSVTTQQMMALLTPL